MPDMKFCPWCGSSLWTKTIAGKDRAACVDGPCGYVFWDNPITVVAAIVEHEGAVILTRSKGWPEKKFGLVAGFLESGESPEDAIVREVREELGLSSEIRDFIGIYTFIQRNQLLLVYYLIALGRLVVGEELEEIRRVAPEKLRPWPFGTGPAVRDWLERRQRGG